MIFNHDEKEGRLGPASRFISIKPILSPPILGRAASPGLPERLRHFTSAEFLFLCSARVGFINKESFLAPAWLFNYFHDL